MAIKGTALKGALAAAPKGRGVVSSLPVGKPPPMPLGKPGAAGAAAGVAQGAGLQRLSPGVYRNQQGQLVNSHGQNLPGQKPVQRPPVAMPAQNVAAANQAAQVAQQYQQQPMVRPPAPNMDQGYNMWAGGSPNFNELAGQYQSHVMPDQYQPGMAVGPGGRIMSVQELQNLQQQRPDMFGSINMQQQSQQQPQPTPYWKGSF